MRAATWMTEGVSSPAILYMLGIIRRRPCEAVKVVLSAPAVREPWIAPAAPASLCISTMSGTTPQRFGLPWWDHASASSPMGEAGVIGYMAITSLSRWAIRAAASFPSMVADGRVPVEVMGST